MRPSGAPRVHPGLRTIIHMHTMFDLQSSLFYSIQSTQQGFKSNTSKFPDGEVEGSQAHLS